MSSDPQATPPGADPALQDDARAQESESPATEQAAAEPSIEQLTRERDEMRDRWLRAEAENQNVRARAKRDVDDTRQYAIQKFAADVVEAAENLRRGLASLPNPAPDEPELVTKLREGLEGVERNFIGIL
ncbi:MAG TPA: nucleotide exchange factor GrpE, partial [Acetobacteraceae bacterium]|nr:nucleotide exchange factor GrpE [Acetobacteraceae bacterium]